LGKTCEGMNWAPDKDALLAFQFVLRRVQLGCRRGRCLMFSIVVIIVRRHVLIFIFFLALLFVYIVKAIQV
jgi:hypothetical protein